jgi:hypothetical protein
MASESTVSFNDLIAYRQQLQNFCATHYNSLTEFQDAISFKISLDEAKLGGEAEHLSSTATCIESLLSCPESQSDAEFLTRAKQVADVLGHESLQTTTIYAKLDLDSLSQLALPWPGGEQ